MVMRSILSYLWGKIQSVVLYCATEFTTLYAIYVTVKAMKSDKISMVEDSLKLWSVLSLYRVLVLLGIDTAIIFFMMLLLYEKGGSAIYDKYVATSVEPTMKALEFLKPSTNATVKKAEGEAERMKAVARKKVERVKSLALEALQGNTKPLIDEFKDTLEPLKKHAMERGKGVIATVTGEEAQRMKSMVETNGKYIVSEILNGN